MTNKAALSKLEGMSDEAFVSVVVQQLFARPKLAPVQELVAECLHQALTSGGSRDGVVDADFGDDSVEGTSELAAQIMAKAREAVLEQTMLSLAELAALLAPPDQDARKMVPEIVIRARSGALLAIERGGKKVYPAFQIDREHRRVYPEVERVNRILGAAADPWGVASWWISPHGRIGAPPMCLLGTEHSKELLSLAKSIHDDGY